MMITQKKQALKRMSYIGLSFFSLMTLFDAQAEKPTSLTEDYTEEVREAQRGTRNGMRAKYSAPQRSTPSHQGAPLCKETEIFKNSAIKLNKKAKDEREESNALGTHIVEGGAAGAKFLIDRNAKNEQTKTVLHQAVDEAAEPAKRFFK